MGKLFTKETFYTFLKTLHPYSNFEVLEYNSINQPAKIKCLECGKIISVDIAEKLTTRINLCKEKHFNSALQKAQYFGEKYGFIIKEWNSDKKRYAKLECLKCSEIYYRQHTHLITNPNHCPNCNNSINKQTSNLEDVQKNVNLIFGENEYTILQYKSFHEKALIKHNCGFSWTGRYDSFLKSRGCPKCYKKQSKGEISIAKWLQENNIRFIEQQSLESPYQKYKFDFYLPDYNLAIEYQGEQHYQDKSSIWEPLSKIQYRDNLKKQYCIDNDIELFEISYLNYKNIPLILSSKFND